MALNQQELQALEDAGLIGFFDDNRDLWKELAENAYAHVSTYIEDIRVDDVILILEPALTVTEELQDYLQENKLRQKYWVKYFGDYILDQLWDELDEDGEE